MAQLLGCTVPYGATKGSVEDAKMTGEYKDSMLHTIGQQLVALRNVTSCWPMVWNYIYNILGV